MNKLQKIIKRIEDLGNETISQSDEMGMLRLHAYEIEELSAEELVPVVMVLRQNIRRETTSTFKSDWGLDQHVVRYNKSEPRVQSILTDLMDYILD